MPRGDARTDVRTFRLRPADTERLMQHGKSTTTAIERLLDIADAAAAPPPSTRTSTGSTRQGASSRVDRITRAAARKVTAPAVAKPVRAVPAERPQQQQYRVDRPGREPFVTGKLSEAETVAAREGTAVVPVVTL